MITTADLASYTDDRLDADDAETQRLLDAGLATVRRHCGWHVTPEVTETVVLDGPGSDLLILPTLRLKEIGELIEEGIVADLGTLSFSSRGLVRKQTGYGGGYYGYGVCWTGLFGGISVTMTHGFADAPDFDSAVLSFIDRSSLAGVSGGGREVIGPFSYGAGSGPEAESAFTGAECAILDLYRLEPSP